MVNITEHIKDIVLDLRYASVNNFMHREMYPANTSFTFLRLPAEKALQQVQQTLQKKGLGLKIFDAYRPFDVTKKFWDLVHDERYVAKATSWHSGRRSTTSAQSQRVGRRSLGHHYLRSAG